MVLAPVAELMPQPSRQVWGRQAAPPPGDQNPLKHVAQPSVELTERGLVVPWPCEHDMVAHATLPLAAAKVPALQSEHPMVALIAPPFVVTP